MKERTPPCERYPTSCQQAYLISAQRQGASPRGHCIMAETGQCSPWKTEQAMIDSGCGPEEVRQEVEKVMHAPECPRSFGYTNGSKETGVAENIAFNFALSGDLGRLNDERMTMMDDHEENWRNGEV